MSDFTPINTQEEFDAAIADRITRAKNAGYKEAEAKYGDYESLKTQVAGIEQMKSDHASELAKVNEKLSAIEKENSGYKRADLVRAATKKFGIDYDSSSQFISGSTAEEITASAEALSKIVGHSGGAPLRNTAAGDSSVGDSIRKMAHELSKR